ncbi:mate-domain-containing protein [Phycomyces nitens]|nr:mate-domain-containing protein [Phycomyces nitens]
MGSSAYPQEANEAGSTRSSISSTPTEHTSLLPKKLETEVTPKSEFWWLLTNSLPIVGTYLLQNSLQMASIFTLGHLGPTQLAASALASMFASVSAWSVAFGTATALDTLCSQAWTGAHDKKLLGVHLQRALIILAMLFIPIAIIWWNATRILLALGQEEELALHAGMFLRVLIIGAPAFIAFEAVKKFLQAQGIMRASTYVLFIAAPLNLAMNYMFVYQEPFNFGFIGAPLATSVSYWIMLLLLLGYIRWFSKANEAWGGWTRECLTGWWPFLRLAIPGVLMVCSEWWAFELAALAASYLGTVDLAAQSIVLTSGSAAYTIPYGISIAASNRVGNALGEGNAQKAKMASKMAMVFAVAFASINSFFFMATRKHFGYMFTSDPEVVALVASILPFCAFFQLADGLSGVCGGVIRGLGRQKVAAWINLFSYYVIALPIGAFLTFSIGWRLKGLWTGLSLALFIAALGEMVFLRVINWDAEVERILERVHHEEEEIHEHEVLHED